MFQISLVCYPCVSKISSFMERGPLRKIFAVILTTLTVLLSVHCGADAAVGGFVSNKDALDEVDLSLPTAAEARISNGAFSIDFVFKGTIELENGEGQWTDAEIQPFREAGQRWLEIVKGPGGAPDFEMKVFVQVRPYEDGLAVASPHFGSIQEINGNYFAAQGEIVLASYNYTNEYYEEYETARDAEEEFVSTIMHELAHISGVGTLWNLDKEDGDVFPDDEGPDYRNWVKISDEYGGPYYKRPAALSAYRDVFGDWEFVPILNELGHVYFEDDDNPLRILPDGRTIPSAYEELMGDGIYFTAISAGMLEDLGWSVDYSKVDEYPEVKDRVGGSVP